ncbi:MAG: TolC family protein [Elusimicrobia bacterium]|nr:TolC family protein [Elusimicrobiota bacterium]
MIKTLILSLLLSAPAAAQTAAGMSPLPPEQAPDRVLTWEDCVALAAQKNPGLVSSQYAKQAGRASYLGSFNGLLPGVSLSNSYSSSNGSSGKPGYSAAASASISLFDMGQIAGIRSASAGYSQAEANLRQASASLRFSLRSAFTQAFIAEKNVEVARKILEIRQRNSEEVSLKYQSGKEYKGNMLNAQAQLLQSRASLAQALRSVRTARRALDQQLGLDDFSAVSVTGTLTALAPPELPADLDELISNRPDVLVQEAVIKAQRASVASAQSPLWPSLSADYTRSRSAGYEFPGSNYGWSAGATLSYPIFGGGPTSTYFAVKGAKNNLEKSLQDLRSVRNAALVDLENNWAAYANAVDQLRVAEASLESARQRNAEAEVRYASGLLSFDNWEVIVGEWVSAEQQAIFAQSGTVTAQAAWEKSLGKALGE